MNAHANHDPVERIIKSEPKPGILARAIDASARLSRLADDLGICRDGDIVDAIRAEYSTMALALSEATRRAERAESTNRALLGNLRTIAQAAGREDLLFHSERDDSAAANLLAHYVAKYWQTRKTPDVAVEHEAKRERCLSDLRAAKARADASAEAQITSGSLGLAAEHIGHSRGIDEAIAIVSKALRSP